MPSTPPDYDHTSARPDFTALPEMVRAEVARLAGGPISRAEPPVTSGFTGSYAGTVHLADSRRVFVKAAGPAMPHVVAGLRREAEVLPRLAALACASRLIGAGSPATDEGVWEVLVLEHLAGHQPGMPWTTPDADAAHDACLEVASAPVQLRADLGLTGVASEVLADPEVLALFPRLATGAAPWPPQIALPSREQFAELDGLIQRIPSALAGTALCHLDVRPDNLLIVAGRAVLVDWNWVCAGPPWLDFVGLWPHMAYDGIDLSRYADSPLLAGVDPDDVDCFLAVLTAYMLRGWDAPPPPGCTPALRAHGTWQAEVLLDLLAARRGWARA